MPVSYHKVGDKVQLVMLVGGEVLGEGKPRGPVGVITSIRPTWLQGDGGGAATIHYYTAEIGGKTYPDLFGCQLRRVTRGETVARGKRQMRL